VIGDGNDDPQRLDDPARRQVGQGPLDRGDQLRVTQQPPNGGLIENEDA